MNLMQGIAAGMRKRPDGVSYGGALRYAGISRPRSTIPTPRELQVLDLIVEGHSNESIANQLELSILTIKPLVHKLMQKFCAVSRLELAVLVLKQRHMQEIEEIHGYYRGILGN